jgi:hypothetical protein
MQSVLHRVAPIPTDNFLKIATMHKLATALYNRGLTELPVETIDTIALPDAVQQREVNFRVHRPAGSGRYPVIVFSHGSMCSPASYDSIARAWAAAGYLVVLPEHTDAPERLSSGGPPDLKKLLSSRIRDLSFAADAVPELVAMAGADEAVDTGHLVAAGHSFGALTAAIKTGLALKPGEYIFDGATDDDRYSAAISMSGVGPLPPFAEDAFAGLTRPLFVSGGTLDEGNVGAGPVFPWEWRMSPYTLAPSGEKYSLVLEQGDHYLGGLIGRNEPADPGDAEGFAILRLATLAFLDAFGKGQGDALQRLKRANVADLTGGRARFEFK